MKLKSRNPQIEFDRLQMYFGEPYIIDLQDAIGSLTVYEPTIGDIIKIGEERFYSTLNIFITNTTSYRLPLWEMGIDWNEISDFELFCLLYQNIDHNVSSLIFKDVVFSDFEKSLKTVENKDVLILYNPKTGTEINENVYLHFSQYLRNVFNIFPEEKMTKDKFLKNWFIDKDKREIKNKEEKEKHEGKDYSNSLQTVISACVNHPGFKYKLKELKEVGVCEFYDSVQRLQIYENTTALLKGMYSGFIDSSKISPDNYNFMKKI